MPPFPLDRSRSFKKQVLPHANALSWEQLHFTLPKCEKVQTPNCWAET